MEIEELKKDIYSWKSRAHKAESEVDHLKEGHREILSGMQLQILTLQVELNSWRLRAEKAESTILILQEKLSVVKRKKKERGGKIKGLEDLVARYELRIQELMRENDSIRLSGRDKEEELEESRRRLMRTQTTIEEYTNEIALLREKLRILAEEIQRLQEENEDTTHQMELYKQKYVEFSNMVEKLNSTLSRYVITCAQLEALKNNVERPSEKKRSSITEQLAALDSSSRSSVVVKKLTDTIEYD